MLFRRKPCFYTGGWAVLTEKCTGFRQSCLEILVLLLLPGVEIQEALCRGEYSPIMRLCSQEWEEFQSLLSPVLLLNPNLVFSPSTKASPLTVACSCLASSWGTDGHNSRFIHSCRTLPGTNPFAQTHLLCPRYLLNTT